MKKGLIAIIGPTAVGKTRLAIECALSFNGEIVNADSRQVYRFMDIGTAKPTAADRASITHHLIDIVNPDGSFSQALYQKKAYEAINDIQERNKIPFLVGGSGLYVWSVIEGWQIPEVPPDHDFRKSLEERAREDGGDSIYQYLLKIDSIAAAKILPGNIRRIIRALEVHRATGCPPSQFWQKKPPEFPILIIGLTADRKELYRLIDSRVDRMVQDGLIEETGDLMAKGYGPDLPSMSGIGYRQMVMFLNRELTREESIMQMKYATHKFARHQYAWFHLNDDRIKWFDIRDDIKPEIIKLLETFVYNNSND
ncbi:tRNA (adenosine(37)-N6)-dimethylallyltransferase MiaA [Chloroflexota bacterium]